MKVVYAIIFTLLIHFTYSQSSPITWGPEYKISNKVLSPFVIGQSNDHYFILRNNYKKNYLESYNINTLAKENSVLIGAMYEETALTFLYSFMFDDKPTFLFAGQNAEANKINYFLGSYDPVTLVLGPLSNVGYRDYIGPIIKTTGLLSLGLKSFYSSDLQFYFNQDNTGFLMGINQTPFEYYDYDENYKVGNVVKFLTINQYFEVVASAEVDLPLNNFETQSNGPSSDGQYLITGLRDETKHEVLKYNFTTSELISSGIILENAKIHSYSLREGHGNITFSGLTKSGDGGINGSFMNLYDANLKLVSSSVEIFEDEFIKSMLSKKEISKSEKKDAEPLSLNDYYITDFFTTEDGGTITIAEQFVFRMVTTPSANGGSSTSYIYTYGDLLAIKRDAAGKLIWKTAIYKNQISSNDDGRYSSFFAYESAGALKIIFNEEASDMLTPYTNGEVETQGQKVVGNMVTIDENGQLTKERMAIPEELFLRIVPKSCAVVGDKVVVYARTKSAAILGKYDL